jgi:hypothetical protein
MPFQQASTDNPSLTLQVIDFSPITSMYGAVHCSSQVRAAQLACVAVVHSPLFPLITATAPCSIWWCCPAQVIKRTKDSDFQQWIQTSDGQRLQWPPKALQETLGPAASAALAAIPGMPPIRPPQHSAAGKA